MNLLNLEQALVSGKKIFVRADFDVPLAQRTRNNKQTTIIVDDSRLKACLPTIEYLLKNKARQIVLAGHIGRPSGKVATKLSAEPIAYWLKRNLPEIPNSCLRRQAKCQIPNRRLNGFRVWIVTQKLMVLENLRFYPGEEENDPQFAKQLAGLADLYVNEAFANSHRLHASMAALPRLLPAYAGLRLQKEIQVLSKILNSPPRPLVVIVGGAKLETKLPLIEKMHHLADYVLIGGKIAEQTRQLAKIQRQALAGARSELLIADLTNNQEDITMESIELFAGPINLAGAIVWNGPLGVFEKESSQDGTRIIAELIAANRQAYRLVGGGETAAALKKFGLISKMDWVSTGGGAMLEYLAQGNLPALAVLKFKTL